MPRRKDKFTSGYYYHIYNRVLESEILFPRPTNYSYCLNLVKKSARKHRVSMIAYCLMPNHYHFLLKQLSDNTLSQFVASVFNPYVQAINRQVGRKGPIFEGRFRHIPVEREEYLIHLCRYIHLNPVQGRIVQNPGEWPFSNYLEWIGKREGTLIDEDFICDHFSSKSSYEEFVTEYLIDNEIEAFIERYKFD